MSDAAADPFLVASAGLACAAMALSGPPAGAMGGAAALVLVVPGYALGHALVPGARGAERLALSIGLSLAVSVLTGLGLAAENQLTPGAWAAALAAVTGLCALAMPETHAEPRGTERWRRRRWAVPLVAAAALAIGVSETALLDEARGIWRLSGGTALAMLRRRPGAGAGDLSLAVTNAGPREVTCALSVEVPGLPAMSWPALRVAPGRNWEVDLPVPAEATGRVSARLDTGEPGAPIRKVTAWIGPRPEDGWAPASSPAEVGETPGPSAATALAADASGATP